MNPVFLDTVGLLALWNLSDQWHDAASKAFALIGSQRRPLITTSYVLLECGNAVARQPFRGHVCRLREMLEKRNELVVPSEEDWAQAWDAYDRGEAGDAGIVDHVSFIIMRRLKITDAFTNDRHFQTAGFIVLF